jgi:hypothetical protein
VGPLRKNRKDLLTRVEMGFFVVGDAEIFCHVKCNRIGNIASCRSDFDRIVPWGKSPDSIKWLNVWLDSDVPAYIYLWPEELKNWILVRELLLKLLPEIVMAVPAGPLAGLIE